MSYWNTTAKYYHSGRVGESKSLLTQEPCKVDQAVRNAIMRKAWLCSEHIAQRDGEVQLSQYHRVLVQARDTEGNGIQFSFSVYKHFSTCSVHTAHSGCFWGRQLMLLFPWEQNGKHSAFKAAGWTGASRPLRRDRFSTCFKAHPAL